MKYDLGFLGGGQLARMSIQAAQRMGLRCLSLDPAKDTPAGQIADALQGPLDDPESITKILSQCAKVTLENEFIPARAVRDALAALPERYRAVLELYYLSGLRYREIAVALGVPLGTVKTHINRAKERLRGELEGARFERSA